MKKFIVFVLIAIAIQIVIAQTGMLNFQQDLAGNAQSGSFVPVDGGLATMLIGSGLYIYNRIIKG